MDIGNISGNLLWQDVSAVSKSKNKVTGRAEIENQREQIAAWRKRRGAGYGAERLSSSSAGSYQNRFESALWGLSSNRNPYGVTESWVEALRKRFEPESGTRTDSFDRYVNKMAAVYDEMKSAIEEKYEKANRQKEYYVAEDGSMQELTKEKELEMLDVAYKRHSEFLATSTEIWDSMRNSNYYTTYGANGSRANTSPYASLNYLAQLGGSTKTSGAIKAQAYRAFLSAINYENSSLLKGTTGSLNHLKLGLGISSQDRGLLNDIWNYYSNIKRY